MNYTVANSQAAIRPHTPHQIARIFVLVLVVVFFEGAIRKWLLPGTTLVWMALRDGMVAYGIAVGMGRGWLKISAWQEGAFVAWTILVTVWASLQVVADKQPALVAIVGLRSWLFYMWFAWLCARTMNRDDVEWVIKIVALTVIPMSLLAITQHLLPPESPLNRQAEGGEVNDVFMAGKSVRTTATFSFTSGFVSYLLFVSPIAICALMGHLTLKSTIVRSLIFITWAAGVLVAGARHSVITAGIMLACALLAIIFRKGNRKTGVAFGMALMSVTLAALPLALPTAIEANKYRFMIAGAHEDLGYRIAASLFGTDSIWEDLPFLGQGIGMGNNAAGVLSGGSRGFLLAEDETARALLEAGLLGLLFLIAKLVVVMVGVMRGFSKLRTTGDMVPWMLWMCVTMQIPAPMLGQLTAHAFAWLTLALAWASLNVVRPATVATRQGHVLYRLSTQRRPQSQPLGQRA